MVSLGHNELILQRANDMNDEQVVTVNTSLWITAYLQQDTTQVFAQPMRDGVTL